MKKLIIILTILFSSLFSSNASADCECVCINNSYEAICNSRYDIKPLLIIISK